MMLKILLAISLPLSMMVFVFSGRARRNSIFLLIGLVVTFIASYVNLWLGCLPVSDVYYVSNIGPIVEEILKAIPILIYAFIKKPERQDLLEGGLSVGLGFAIIENVTYMIRFTDRITLLAALFRGLGAGMMHGLTTMVVAFGMSFITLKKKLFFVGTLTFMSIAISFHSIYNMLVQSQFQIIGFLIPIVTFMIILIIFKNHNFDYTFSDVHRILK